MTRTYYSKMLFLIEEAYRAAASGNRDGAFDARNDIADLIATICPNNLRDATIIRHHSRLAAHLYEIIEVKPDFHEMMMLSRFATVMSLAQVDYPRAGPTLAGYAEIVRTTPLNQMYWQACHDLQVFLLDCDLVTESREAEVVYG